MKMILVLLFLWSGFFHLTFTSQRLRLFSIPDISKLKQNESVHECNKTNESLVTMYDKEDEEFIRNYTKMDTRDDQFWLGLRKRQIITWLDGTPYTSNLIENVEMCQAIDNRTWNVSKCSDEKFFMCYDAESDAMTISTDHDYLSLNLTWGAGSNYDLIESEKTWCQALKHCRDNSSELVSIRNEKQNITVIEEGRNTNFWIGLMLDEWEWEDKSCSSFRKWNKKSRSAETESNCTSYIYSFASISPLQCWHKGSPLCSKGTVRIIVIEQPKTWEEAFNYCKDYHTRLLWIRDKSDQEAVEQWLNHTDVSGPFWIGLRQSRIFGFWLWSSDTTVGQYDNWKDRRTPELPLSNHCGVIKRDNYTWSDEDCQVPLSFLCEEDIIFHVK